MSLPVFQATIVNSSGDIIPSAVVTVLDEITGLGLTIYSDRAGTVPLGTNGVFTAGTDGFAQFFAPAGNYRVKAEQAASGFEKTWNFVPLVGEAAFVDTGTGAGQVPTNADLPTFGTAATANVQTSPTDNTAGRLMAVGAFGLGLSTGLNSSADLNTYLVSGQYSVQSASPNNPAGNAILTVGVRNNTNVTQFLEATIDSLGIYRRTLSAGTWSAWQRTDPQAFGLGGFGQVLSDIDAATNGTHFSFVTGTTSGDIPYPSGSGFQYARGATRKTQIAFKDGSSPGGCVSIRNYSGTWSDWQRIDPQAFGLGTGIENNPAFIGDVETINTTAFQRLSQISSNIPVVDDGFITSKYRGANNISLTIEYDNGELWRKTKDGTWSAWQPVYTGANYQPETAAGIGVVRRMQNQSGGSIVNGATVAGSSLRHIETNASGSIVTGVPSSGSYKAVSNQTVDNGNIAEFVRTA